MKKRILIYEDDLELLRLCEIILSSERLEVFTRNRCENILADVEEVDPNLILMDLWIPEIGGEQAISLMKKEPKYEGIPVILFSANAEIETITQGVNAQGYLKKPFDISELKQIVARHLT